MGRRNRPRLRPRLATFRRRRPLRPRPPPDRFWQPSDDGAPSHPAGSGDASHAALGLTGTPPRVGVFQLATREFSELPGAAFAWAGRGITLLVADPASSRLYLKDL